MRPSVLLPALLLGLCAAALPAQQPSSDSVRLDRRAVSLSGPRFGVTMVSGSLADTLEQKHGAQPVLSQFGWQFETRIFRLNEGLTGMTELVGLIAGLEQGVVLPSVSWLVALRGSHGFEVGLGPNVSPSGAALVGAVGMNMRYSNVINIPVNVAVASGRGGTRTSLLFGFYLDR